MNVTERTVRQRPKYKLSIFVKQAQQVLISFIRQIYDIPQNLPVSPMIATVLY